MKKVCWSIFYFGIWARGPNVAAMLGRAAFTLLEICLAIVIGLMLLSMAIPGLRGLFERRAMEQSFEAFDALVRQAQLSATEQRETCAIVLEKQALVVRKINGHEVARRTVPKDQSYTLDFPAAMLKKPEPIWMFWPTGTCEPATVAFKSRSTSWVATYNPLTVRAMVEEADEK